MKTIKDTGIYEQNSNGARLQEIVFKDGDSKFRIFIKDESYKAQSYARLSKWTDKEGWEVITSENPYNNVGGSISYKTGYSANAFKANITSLKKIAKEFV